MAEENNKVEIKIEIPSKKDNTQDPEMSPRHHNDSDGEHEDSKSNEAAPLVHQLHTEGTLLKNTTTPRGHAHQPPNGVSKQLSLNIRTPKVNRELSVLSMGGGYNKIETGVSLTWKNLTYTVNQGTKDEKTILNNLSGYVGPGNVLVILGPSGSGKTSLLSILSGNRVHTDGDIYYQGRLKTVNNRSEDIMGFHGNASYVAQDDTLMGSLTVKETLRYAAKLKISDPEIDKEAQIDAIIKQLGLDVCKDTLVGTPFIKGVSGGQKRRLSIGVELVTQPGILFLDEVTSGLDATSAYQLLRLISKLANLGHSIVMTLHQPTSRLFKLMCDSDHYMLILESGHQSYFGYARDSIDYFESLGYKVPPFNNATDYFLDLVNRDFEKSENNNNNNNAGKKQITLSADIINDAFARDYLPLIKTEIDNINESFKNNTIPKLESNSFFIQLFTLLSKNFFNLLRNPGIFWIRLFLYASLSMCLGTLYFDIDNDFESTQDRINLIFFLFSFFTFMSISAMPAFVEERAIYMRERMNNHYSTLSFVLANFLSPIPWIFLLSLVCSGIVYLLVQFRWGWEYFGMYLLTMFVVMMVAENLMVAISATSSLFMVGLAGAAGLLGLMMTVSGYVIKSENIPVGWKWAYYVLSYHTYAFEIFMDNDFRDNNNVDIGDTGDGLEDVDVAFDFLVLCIMMVVYRIIFYFLLKFLHRRQN